MKKIVSVWLEAVMIIEGIAEDVDASISSLENIGLLKKKTWKYIKFIQGEFYTNMFSVIARKLCFFLEVLRVAPVLKKKQRFI